MLNRSKAKFRSLLIVLVAIFSLSSTMVPTSALDLGAKAKYIISVTPSAKAAIEATVVKNGWKIDQKYNYVFDGYTVELPKLVAGLLAKIPNVLTVEEDREVFASLTVKENLSLAARSKDSSASYKFVYDLFPELDTRAAQQAGSLSGGQQQMVAIARALLNKNEILLVDEPTKGLAPKLVTEVAEALTKVAEQSTMLLVEQNLALVKRVAQHVIVMDQGRVVYQGGPENLNDDSWVHQMLGVSGGHK